MVVDFLHTVILCVNPGRGRWDRAGEEGERVTFLLPVIPLLACVFDRISIFFSPSFFSFARAGGVGIVWYGTVAEQIRTN